MVSRFVTVLLALAAVVALAGANNFFAAAVRAEKNASLSAAQPPTPAQRAELLEAREAVWRAWFSNDRQKLDWMVPAGTVAINAGAEEWEGREQVLAGSHGFVEGGGRLVRLEFSRTEIQLYGDVAILYSQYLFETDTKGRRDVTAGRATEIFVRREGRWTNPGWHTDSGR